MKPRMKWKQRWERNKQRERIKWNKRMKLNLGWNENNDEKKQTKGANKMKQTNETDSHISFQCVTE
jgi:hypothetical protein